MGQRGRALRPGQRRRRFTRAQGRLLEVEEEIREKIRELGRIKPAFLRRLGPSVTKEELESVYKKKRALNL